MITASLGKGVLPRIISYRKKTIADDDSSAAQRTVTEQPLSESPFPSEAIQTQGRNVLQVLNQNGFDVTVSSFKWREALFCAAANDQEDVTWWIKIRGTCDQESQYISNTALYTEA